MAISYQPYVDPEYESLMERIHPPRVSIDNKTCHDCTLVKVDSVNRRGILLEMVQVLTDLDLVISKSYISSDGGWFMDVFHVTDQFGNKITDKCLIHYIQQAICASKSSGATKEVESCVKGEVRPRHVSTEHTAIEMTLRDRPGLLSEIAAALYQLGCNIAAAVAWTHNTRVACIIYVEEGFKGGAITDPTRLAQVQYHMENVVGAHHENWERRSVRLTVPAAGRTHTERRLHQLMYADMDYEQCRGCDGCSRQWNGCGKTHVSIETCNEKGYSVVNVRCRDRPKLLFDTVCLLTDMQYVVFHAAVSSEGCIANQEYFIRQKDGCTLNTEAERHKLKKCLIAAVERRVSHGLRLDVRIQPQNRMKLLSDVTRVFRENGLSIARAEIGTQGDKAVGSFYVTDASGNDVNPNTVEMVRREIGGSVLVVNKSSSCITRPRNGNVEERPRLSLGNLLWAQLERLSGNFGLIRS